MKRRRKSIAALFVVPCLLVALAMPASQALGAPSATTSVIGGTQAVQGEFPFMAFVADVAHGATCSGTVVAPRVVLTAAHCVTDLNTGAKAGAAGFRVLTGSVDLASPERQISKVTRVVSHPGFSFSGPRIGFGDAALLQLETPTTAPPVSLASAEESRSMIRAGKRAYVAGWGRTQFGVPSPVEFLVWGQLTIEGTHCEGLPGRICAIDFPKAVTSTCHGDSGGPLLVNGPKGLIQLGITHTVFGRCSPRRPDTFTRLDTIGKWLRTSIRNLE